MLNKNKLQERKGERMYIHDDMTNKERKTQKKLRVVARQERETDCYLISNNEYLAVSKSSGKIITAMTI
jgi:hypothetical protein